jgi:hypothetical protein
MRPWVVSPVTLKTTTTTTKNQKQSIVVHACDPSYKGGINRKIAVQAKT